MLRQEEIYNQAALQIGPLEVLAPSDPAQFDTAATSLPVSWLHKLQSRLFAAQSPKHVCADGGLHEVHARCAQGAEEQYDPHPGAALDGDHRQAHGVVTGKGARAKCSPA